MDDRVQQSIGAKAATAWLAAAAALALAAVSVAAPTRASAGAAPPPAQTWRATSPTGLPAAEAAPAAAGKTAAGGAASPGTAGAASAPVVTGPVQGGVRSYPFMSLHQLPSMPLSRAGFVEREYFLAGNATSHTATGTWGSDGKWSVAPSTSAPYKTRLLVERPADPARFNGTVVVEWLNVTAGVDVWADFAFMHEELLRRGYAYVGVSAQSVGVTAMRTWDPQRYGSLVHPGDAFSFDIFTQVAAALRGPGSPLRGYRVEQLLADGESQSAMRMTTYANAIQPVTEAYDGFLIHSRFPSAVPVDSAVPAPTPSHIRDDLDVPVLQVQSETDLQLAGANATTVRQPDSRRLRTWEIPGTAHLDGAFAEYTLAPLTRDAPTVPPRGCDKLVNNGEQRFVMNAALRGLARWAAGGRAPQSAPPITTAPDGTILRDARGNALGGLRTPALDAPFAAYNGSGNSPGLFCSLLGTTAVFDQATLKALYPTHGHYVAKVRAAARTGLRKGYLLPEDARVIVADAQASPVGA